MTRSYTVDPPRPIKVRPLRECAFQRRFDAAREAHRARSAADHAARAAARLEAAERLRGLFLAASLPLPDELTRASEHPDPSIRRAGKDLARALAADRRLQIQKETPHAHN